MNDEEETVFSWQIPEQVQQNLENEEMHLPDFKSIKHYIFAFPLLNEIIDAEIKETFPCMGSRGYDWGFVLQDQDKCDVLQWISYEMLDAWGISTRRLMQEAKINVSKSLSEAAYMVLFGRINSKTVVPFCKFYFKGEEDGLPFGSSLILSDTAMNRINSLMGDFTFFLPDIGTVYALPSAILKKKGIHPQKAIRAIMEETPEGAPAFFQAGLLFPEKATNDHPDAWPP